ncbi:MAG: FAD-binding protein [Phycisphaerae bacterium]|nr:FAD-binding protein [Phycisphaerae bacterium]
MHVINSKPDARLVAGKLKGLLRGQVLADRASQLLYSTDASIYRVVPLVVVQPVDADDVARTMLFAAEAQVPLAPRGAGTGLAGESLTTGIVLDFTRHMTGLADSDDENTVRVQPGTILDRVNQTYQPRGWRFGPDPSSASRATVGGSIGNNATGAHSLRYGYTDQHVEQLEVVLSDGRLLTLSGNSDDELARRAYQLLAPKKHQIAQHWPKVQRNRAGYNLPGTLSNGHADLIRLIAGSEGTLAVITAATLKLVPVKKVSLLLQANFDSLDLMGEALPDILKYDPSAVELMDAALLAMAKQAYPSLTSVLPDAAASLLIEFDADQKDDAAGRLEDCRQQLAQRCGSHAQLRRFDDPADQARQFEARKRAVPLLYRKDPINQPIPAVEDIAIPPEKMAQYVAGMQQIFQKHDLQATYYAHAGPGELHIRPYLDLRTPEHRKVLAQLAREAYQLTWQLGGTISGEHGVGLLRGWALRKQYGPVYDLMAEVKKLFDPQNILNPGKIITEETDLPLDAIRAEVAPTARASQNVLDFGERDLFRMADLCNGCGECKSCSGDQLMCPVFRARNDEALSPRGRAAILREYLAGNLTDEDLQSYPGDLSMDLCLLCGNCARECPSGVDTPTLVIEARARRNAVRRPKLSQRFFAHSDKVIALASKFGPISDLMSRNPLVKRVFELAFNVHPARSMPPFASAGFLWKIRRLVKKYKVEKPVHRAVWFLDLMPRYHDPALAEAFVQVCAKNGIELVVPPQKPSGITELVYGHIDSARRMARYNLDHLNAALADAEMILCLEPTATLCLKKEYAYLVRSGKTVTVADAAKDATAFLLELAREGRLNTDLTAKPMHLAYHCPCHTRLLGLESPGRELLAMIPELKVTPLPAQCCGLSGTFGMQADKYGLSMQIAETLRAAVETLHPDATASECSTCRMQLHHLANLPSRHPIELLAQAYG